MSKQKSKSIIDIDKAIKVYNKNNPDNRIDRYKLADELGVGYQSLVNYSTGKAPLILGVIKKIMDKTGITFNELVKEKNDEE